METERALLVDIAEKGIALHRLYADVQRYVGEWHGRKFAPDPTWVRFGEAYNKWQAWLVTGEEKKP